MKKKNIIVAILAVIIITSGLVLYFAKDKDQVVKGNLTIWTSSGNEYLNEIAQDFMKNNDRCKIEIINVSSEEYQNKLKEAFDKNKPPDIINVNSENMESILEELDGKNIEIKNQKDILSNYSSNFTERRLQEVFNDDKEIGIPFTSNPITFYLREDMLNEYGYTYTKFNTWEDVVNFGKDIYTKSQGKLRILNYVGKDKEYLISLLIMQAMEGSRDEEKIREEVENKIKYLTENNILNYDEKGAFLARVSSLEAMRELKALEVSCSWTANNPPSKTNGSNKFYLAEGSNLIVLKEDGQKEQLRNKFLGFLVGSNSYSISHVRKGEFFLSYLSTYNTSETERSINNFIGKSPLVVMANIAQKAPTMKDYELYKEIKSDFIK